MRKHVKRLLSLAISAALCMGLCVPAMAANEDNTLGITFSVILDQNQINVSDTEQTVTMTIAMSKEAAIDSMEFIVTYDSPLVPAQPTDIPAGFSSWGEALSKQSWMNMTPQSVSTLGKVAFTIPAGTPAGTYNVGVTGIKLSNNMEYWETEATASTALTIVDPSNVPATGAALSAQSLSLTVGGDPVTLTASLEPADTTEEISNIQWTSDNTDVATVEGGVVTAVAAGEATITATVTTDKNNTFTADCVVTVTAGEQPPQSVSPYTVTIADATEGADKVHAGDAVAMDVTVTGGSFNAFDLYVTYDTGAFTYLNAANTDANTSVTESNGVIHIQSLSTDSYADTTKVATLNFTAKDVDTTATGDFDFDSTKTTVAQKPIDADQDVVPANVVPDSVTVVKQYTVIFQDKDGVAIEDGTFTLDDGASVTTVPDAPPVDYYTFDKWYIGETGYTAEEILASEVTADVTYTAVYTANTYDVTLGEGLTGAATATYGTDYTGSITDYDGNSYTYTVTYGEGKTATVNTDGTFTIPGTEITGDLTVSVSKVIQGITVTTHVDFITGYTLIEVKGNAANYSYDGNDMYYVAASGDNYGSYVYLVQGEADQTKVAMSANAKTEIPTGNDVNMTGVVDFSDANAAFCIYNKVDVWSLENENAVDKLMEKIIRADVNRDYTVDTLDVGVILEEI